MHSANYSLYYSKCADVALVKSVRAFWLCILCSVNQLQFNSWPIAGNKSDGPDTCSASLLPTWIAIFCSSFPLYSFSAFIFTHRQGELCKISLPVQFFLLKNISPLSFFAFVFLPLQFSRSEDSSKPNLSAACMDKSLLSSSAFHFLSYPLPPLASLLSLSLYRAVRVFVPWVTRKTPKVLRRSSVMCRNISGMLFSPFTIHFAYILWLVHRHTQTHTDRHTHQQGFDCLSCLWSKAAGCWELQMPHYVRCVYQMPVYSFFLSLCLTLCMQIIISPTIYLCPSLFFLPAFTCNIT